jgi:hypothetical protein
MGRQDDTCRHTYTRFTRRSYHLQFATAPIALQLALVAYENFIMLSSRLLAVLYVSWSLLTADARIHSPKVHQKCASGHA